jgi:hypothetical protein
LEGLSVKVSIIKFSETFSNSDFRIDAEYYDIFGDHFQSLIQKLVEDAQNFLEESQGVYNQAEALLLKSLGLNHPPLEGRSKSQLASDSGRGFNLKTNYDFNSIKKFPDPSPNASHSTLPQGGNISQYCHNTSINIKSFKDSFMATGRLDAECYQLKYEEVIAHIKAQPYAKLSELVTVKKSIALNSKLVRMQAERDAGGSIILHWRIGEIEEVLIPVIDPKTQSQISLLVQESFALKSKSEKLL